MMNPIALSSREAAWFSFVGNVFDALGGLYLAYDIFKRHSGLLGILTRAATYSVVLSIPPWLALGPSFGAIAGIGLGIMVAFENWFLARHQRLQHSSPLTQSAPAGFMRGVIMGVASVPRFGWRFGALFVAASAPLTATIYGFGLVPTYRPYAANRLGLKYASVRAYILRSLALGIGAAVAAYWLQGLSEAEHIGFLVAFWVAVASFAIAMILPFVEYHIENASDKFFIYAGLLLLLFGLICDSIPSIFILVKPLS